MESMALVVFLRGINVGGHRAFRPSVLAKELGIFGAVNVGAAGTLVVREPGLRAEFLAELRRKLPFEATIAFCDGSDLIRLEMDKPFGTEPPPADAVQFVSILSEAGRRGVSIDTWSFAAISAALLYKSSGPAMLLLIAPLLLLSSKTREVSLPGCQNVPRRQNA